MTTHLLGPVLDTYFLRRKPKGVPSRYWDELEEKFSRHIVPALGGRGRVLSTITKTDLRLLIEQKEDEGYPVAARTLYECLSTFFKWCLGRDIIVSNPMATYPPPRVPESRDRVLSESELKAVWRATYAMSLYGPFYRLLMLTCQRRNEVTWIKYSEIDGSTWTIPGRRTKNGKTHVVHLSQQAMDIVNSKPEFIERGLSGYSRAKSTLDRLSGVSDWRIHDLRRTGATKMQEFGVLPEVIELILNHKPKGVFGIYQRHKYSKERKDALDLLGLYYESLGTDL